MDTWVAGRQEDGKMGEWIVQNGHGCGLVDRWINEHKDLRSVVMWAGGCTNKDYLQLAGTGLENR